MSYAVRDQLEYKENYEKYKEDMKEYVDAGVGEIIVVPQDTGDSETILAPEGAGVGEIIVVPQDTGDSENPVVKVARQSLGEAKALEQEKAYLFEAV